MENRIKYDKEAMLEAIDNAYTLMNADAEGNQILTFEDIINEIKYQYNDIIEAKIYELNRNKIINNK